MKKIIVTGGNRGIGREICKQLSEMGHQVILAARDVEKGGLAAEQVGADFLQLDVSREQSIKSFIVQVKELHSHIDVLINNAGIYIDGNQRAINVDFQIVEETMNTNLYGPWKIINGLLPLLKNSDDGRIVNISSGYGSMNEMSSGYPAYRMSKVGLNALTQMIAHETSEIKVNSMCPGWVRTDMGGANASRSIEKGAETAVWLSTEKEIPNGKFLRDKKVIEW